MTKTAVLFPGQGAQFVGMAKDIVEAFPPARAVFDEAAGILGYDIASLCFNGPAERLNATDVSQPALFVCSVAIWRAMQANGLADHLQPKAMAGLSLGEYTALHLAGWMTFEDGLRLVARRGQLMQKAAEETNGGMVSIMGLDEVKVEELCREAAHGEVLTPANFNCSGQIVISGTRAACDRAIQLASKYDARAISLVVAGAFHSPLMASAEQGLKKALAEVKITPSQIAVVSNVSADYYSDPNRVRALLCEQVARSIRWQAAMERLIADGYGRFAEVGAGRVLTGLMKKINRSVKMENYSTLADLQPRLAATAAG